MDDPATGADVEVRAHLELDGSHVLVIGVPEGQSLADPGELQLVEVRPGAVSALDEDRFRQISRLLIDQLEDTGPTRQFRPLTLLRDTSIEQALALLISRRGDGDTILPTTQPQPTLIPPPPTIASCPQCGHAVFADHRYCGYCGVEVRPP
jgi:hypothetical protein